MVQVAIPRPGIIRRNVESKRLSRLKRQRLHRRRSSLSQLTFLKKSKTLLTPFLTQVIQKKYNVAKAELGSSIKSAIVSTWSNPEEPVPPILLLSIVSDVDRTEIRRVRKVILEAIVKEASSWKEAEKEDYSKMIYFELMPADL